MKRVKVEDFRYMNWTFREFMNKCGYNVCVETVNKDTYLNFNEDEIDIKQYGNGEVKVLPKDGNRVVTFMQNCFRTSDDIKEIRISCRLGRDLVSKQVYTVAS